MKLCIVQQCVKLNLWSFCCKTKWYFIICQLMFPSTCHLGGVEPIAEVAGDGEELELPQEMTKFIKKKQPSKKVKKGRSTDSPPLLLIFSLLCCHRVSFPPSCLYLELNALQLSDSSALLHLVTFPTDPCQNTSLQQYIRSIAPSLPLNPDQSPDTDICSLSVTLL